jgi:hypothetical protein
MEAKYEFDVSSLSQEFSIIRMDKTIFNAVNRPISASRWTLL